VRERRVRRGIGDVVGRDEDRLERGDRPALGRRDPFLEVAHLVGERRLVANGRRHPPEQRRDLRSRLREPEDVVDEQQHVLALDVAEVLRHRERREPDSKAHARGLVHLSEHERGLLDDARLGHLEEQVVALARALAHAGEHRDAPVLLGLAADHLLDDHGLADTGPAEHPDLAALHVGLEQVDHLDAGLEHLLPGLEILERGRVAVDRPTVRGVDVRGVGVERVPQDVVDVTEDPLAHRHGDGSTGVDHRRAPDQPVGRPQRDRADDAVADVLGDLAGDRRGLVAERDVHRQGRVDLGQGLGRELHVHDRADDPDNPAVRHLLVGHRHSLAAPARASAPPTISMISDVISS
jgi:peptide chain release factor 1